MKELITYGEDGEGGTSTISFEGHQVIAESRAKETLAQNLMEKVCDGNFQDSCRVKQNKCVLRIA